MIENEPSPNDLAAIGQRFHRFFRSRGYTALEVSQMMDKSPATISKLVNGDRFSSEVLIQIQTTFPSLNLRWLLLAEGQMEDHQQRLNSNFSQQLATLDMDYQRLRAMPRATTTKQEKERVAALAKLIEQGLDLRVRLLSEQLDLQTAMLT